MLFRSPKSATKKNQPSFEPTLQRTLQPSVFAATPRPCSPNTTTHLPDTSRVAEEAQVAQQHPAPYDPNSNGATEAACKRVGGLLRTLRCDFEARFHRIPDTSHPIFAWTVEHTSWILTTRERLTDGRTPYQLARGSKFNREGLPFAECIFYKLNAGQFKRAGEGKLEPRWADGIFLGYSKDVLDMFDVGSKHA